MTLNYRPSIGFIGLGAMGLGMARRLVQVGFSVRGYDVNPVAIQTLVQAGGQAATTAADAAQSADVFVLMVVSAEQVEEVLFGAGGAAGALPPSSTVILCSTVKPEFARKTAARLADLGITMLDAPVSGGEIGAIDGTLSIMVGGDEAAFAAVKPLLDVVGNPDKVIRIGDSGAGQICKVCNQMVIGGTLLAVSEAFALARKSGVAPGRVRDALLGGFAASRVLEVHGERILKANYKPGFRAVLYGKDMRIAAETLAAHNSPAPGSAIVQRLVEELAASKGEMDYSALATVIFEMAGIDA